MSTPYGAPSYQTPTSRNCKPFRTQLCELLTGCTRDTNTQHLYNQTKVLLMDIHLKLHTNQLKQPTQTQTYPSHDLNTYSNPSRNIKARIFYNHEHTNIIILKHHITPKKC